MVTLPLGASPLPCSSKPLSLSLCNSYLSVICSAVFSPLTCQVVMNGNLSDDSSGDEYTPDMEDSADDYDSMSDDELDVPDLEMREVEEGWRLIADVFSDKRPEAVPPFVSQFSGLNPALGDLSVMSFTDAFKLFFDDDLVGKLCEWANERAVQYFAASPEKQGRVNSIIWHPVTRDDMYTFLALVMAMALMPIPRMMYYWSTDMLLSGPAVFCKEVMSRDRFFSIMKFLRFSPPGLVRKNCPATRIEPYLDMLRERCQMVMRPRRTVAVDEALILWKGRLAFRQYMKSKRARFGVKVFVASPSDEQWKGYSWNFMLYYGKDTFFLGDANASHLSVSERIVVKILGDLLDEGRHIITDNWYTSLRLSDYLQTRATLLTGVVRQGRGPPKTVQHEVLEKNQALFARKGNTLLVKWQDKREICILSTKYEANVVEKTKTYFGGKTVFFNKPLQVEKYTKKMGSVDYADQMLEPFESHRKSLAWFKKLGIHFMFRVLLNSFIAYKCAHSSTSVDFFIYIREVSRELLLQYNLGAAVLANVNTPNVHKERVVSNTHQFVLFEGRKRKRCKMCYPTHKDTRYHCPGCDGHPGLCSMQHYRAWHEQEQAAAAAPPQ